MAKAPAAKKKAAAKKPAAPKAATKKSGRPAKAAPKVAQAAVAKPLRRTPSRRSLVKVQPLTWIMASCSSLHCVSTLQFRLAKHAEQRLNQAHQLTLVGFFS